LDKSVDVGSVTETVRAFTYVINQGWALYWGTSRWSAMEIMVSLNWPLEQMLVNTATAELIN